MAKGKVIVVGGGLAGLMATMKIAEMGTSVELFSLVPVKRSHSVCAQGGINGAVNTKGEGDSPWMHFDDTVYGGDFLANQPPVKAMVKQHRELFIYLTGWALCLTEHLKVYSTSAVLVEHSITEQHSLEQQQVNSCYMR